MPSMLNTGYSIVYLKWHTKMTQPKDHIIISNTISPMYTVPPFPNSTILPIFCLCRHLHYSLLQPEQLSSPTSPAMLLHPCTRSKHNVRLHHPSILQPFCSHNWSQHSVIILPTFVITVGAWIFANSSFSRTRFLQQQKNRFSCKFKHANFQ